MFLEEKKKLWCKGYFFELQHLFLIPNGKNVRNSFSNMVLKFHDYPTVVCGTGLVVRGKKVSFGKRRGENEIERKRRNPECENWPNMSLFTTNTYNLLFTLFIYFYYFIILFPFKWINQIYLFFSLKPLFYYNYFSLFI